HFAPGRAAGADTSEFVLDTGVAGASSAHARLTSPTRLYGLRSPSVTYAGTAGHLGDRHRALLLYRWIAPAGHDLNPRRGRSRSCWRAPRAATSCWSGSKAADPHPRGTRARRRGSRLPQVLDRRRRGHVRPGGARAVPRQRLAALVAAEVGGGAGVVVVDV